MSTARGKTFIAEANVTTDIYNDASFSVSTSRVSGFVTATATCDGTGDTSEFSTPRKVVRRR